MSLGHISTKMSKKTVLVNEMFHRAMLVDILWPEFEAMDLRDLSGETVGLLLALKIVPN